MEHNRKQRRIKQDSSKDMPLWKRLWRWTGWRDKKLWDWQAFLFFPVSAALIVSLFTQYQNTRQQEIENLRAERAMVETYLEDIGTLLLEENLRTEGENSDVRLLARARTLVILDGVSEDRKVRLLEFLSETQLIQFGSQGEPPVISLRFANLSETRLVKRRILSNTDLDRAELMGANLYDANLENTELPRADLSGADLTGADLTGADLTGADLMGTKGVSCQQMEQTKSLEDTIMPGGQNYEDWREDKGCSKD
jgi:hypothetical protein